MGRIGGAIEGAVALIVALMLMIWSGCTLGESGPTEAQSPSWRETTDPPDSRFGPSVSVWTGTEILAWGGSILDSDRPRTTPGPPDSGTPEDPNPTLLRDGLAYDPAEDAWARIPRAPVPPLRDTVGAWTGEELLIRGDHRERDRPTRTIQSAGAAYSPERDEWRHLPTAPEGPSYRKALWTGDRLVLLGDAPDFSGRAAAAAYDPDTDAWSRLPDSPGGRFDWPHPVWTGNELLVLSTGGKLAAYSPGSDSWDLRSPSPLGYRSSPIVHWTGERMIAFGGSERVGSDMLEDRWDGASYDPASDTWERIPAPPHEEDQRFSIGTVVVADGDLVIILRTSERRGESFEWEDENHTLAYDTDAQSWRRLPDPPSTLSVPTHWTGREIVYWGEAVLSLR